MVDAGLRHSKSIVLHRGILVCNDNSWHSRCHASLIQAYVLHFLRVDELLEHIDSLSFQVSHQSFGNCVSRLLHFPPVLVNQSLLPCPVESEELLLILVRDLFDIDGMSLLE